LITAIRFNKIVFFRTKNFAFTNLYLTFLWNLDYELDPAVIGKVLGTNQVAIYAIGLTVPSFFRSILGILFSPFSDRFNHFTGIRNNNGLKSFYLQVTTITAPFVVIPILTVSLFARPIILSWVRINYLDSVSITQL